LVFVVVVVQAVSAIRERRKTATRAILRMRIAIPPLAHMVDEGLRLSGRSKMFRSAFQACHDFCPHSIPPLRFAFIPGNGGFYRARKCRDGRFCRCEVALSISFGAKRVAARKETPPDGSEASGGGRSVSLRRHRAIGCVGLNEGRIDIPPVLRA
jgi:hypothetical protein